MRYLSLIVFVVACNSSHPESPDAAVVVDAAPDVAIDGPALVCDSPTKLCNIAGTDTCLDTTANNANCGDCGHKCQTAATCGNSVCNCLAGFVPTATVPSGFDSFQLISGYTVGTTPLAVDQRYDLVSVGYTDLPATGTDFDLAQVFTPYLSATYDFSYSTFDYKAFYYAISGTVNFSASCATELKGTLTNATFRAAVNFVDDPSGCTFTVASLDFDIGTAGGCASSAK